MGFLHCENIWTRAIINNFGMNGVNEKKKGLKEKNIWKKKGLARFLFGECVSLNMNL
jgi:hypothetical protein